MNTYYAIIISAFLVLIGFISFMLFRKKNKKEVSKRVKEIYENLVKQSKTPPIKPERIFASNCKRKVIKNQRQYRKYLRSNPNQTRFK